MQIPNSIPGAQLPARSIEEYRGRTDPEAIKAVAQEMEAMFAYELLKAMRATSETSSKTGLGSNTYTSLFDMELSKLIAKRGLGLKDMLQKGIEKKAATTANNTGENAAVTERGGDAEGAASMMKKDATIRQPLPANKGRISSSFGIRQDPFTGANKFHHGLDVALPEGSEIRPLKRGNVIFSGEQKGYGNVVVIDHGDGFVTKYAHNQINLAQEGDDVTSSTVIARVGKTGKTTGPHTHFEVIYNGKDIDPAAVFGKNS